LPVVVLATACGRIAFDPLTGDAGADGDDTVRVYNRAFVTSQTYGVPWVGATQAAFRCRDAAAAGGLDGAWFVLLGDESTRPEQRPPIASARGWVDLSGAVVVDQPSEWVDGRMRRPLHLDENGVSIGYELVWLGARMGATCDSWNTPTALMGSVAYTTSAFGAFYVSPCDSLNHYICLEYEHNTEVSEPPQPGRIAFLTTTGWSPAGGITAADGVCATEATSHGLNGSFKALLTTSTAAALSRFSLAGAPWIRVDGVRFVDTPMDLANRPVLASFLLRADGTAISTAPASWAWTGSIADNCANWASNAVTNLGLTGDASSAERTQFFARQSATCNESHPLVCLQE
jgi:hypothetical protein